jgi:hypothetical protein
MKTRGYIIANVIGIWHLCNDAMGKSKPFLKA